MKITIKRSTGALKTLSNIHAFKQYERGKARSSSSKRSSTQKKQPRGTLFHFRLLGEKKSTWWHRLFFFYLPPSSPFPPPPSPTLHTHPRGGRGEREGVEGPAPRGTRDTLETPWRHPEHLYPPGYIESGERFNGVQSGGRSIDPPDETPEALLAVRLVSVRFLRHWSARERTTLMVCRPFVKRW